jgi:hypothetical protein
VFRPPAKSIVTLMVNRVLTSPRLCYVVADAAGSPAVVAGSPAVDDV